MKIFTLITSCALLLLTTHMVAQPVTAAPTPPARNAGDVISCFSAAYTDLAGTDWFPNWGQSTVVSEITVAGDVIKKYATFNYQGVQFASSIAQIIWPSEHCWDAFGHKMITQMLKFAPGHNIRKINDRNCRRGSSTPLAKGIKE